MLEREFKLQLMQMGQLTVLFIWETPYTTQDGKMTHIEPIV